MNENTTLLTQAAGSLMITLWYDGVEDTRLHGSRHRWAYQLEDSTDPSWEPVRCADLYLSPVAPNTPDEAMRSLLSFLTACGEAYSYEMRHPGSEPENLGLFPDWAPEAAYLNGDELGMLALELDELDAPGREEPDPAYRDALAGGEIDSVAHRDASERLGAVPDLVVDPKLGYALEHEVDGPEATWPPATFYDIVFLQGEEGYAVVDLIEEKGVDAAIEHLSDWDFQEETRNTALFHGHVYDEAPSNQGGHTAESGHYLLIWHAGLGHVNLLRRFDQADERPAWWPDRTARLSPRVPKDVDPEPPARRSVDRGPDSPGL
ncbi:hypothetical protein L1785_22130 [Antribacter sp. KLBMP9083]|uniref:Uncharacterized protein n=1 Tax=Antribacter soli TaxID=2910976 RepID=A0AA41QHS1_9MICO|nr:hypothetical protein [Antribacter soli]MCF4123664.1 hypothetical protein [Antribacter soli]